MLFVFRRREAAHRLSRACLGLVLGLSTAAASTSIMASYPPATEEEPATEPAEEPAEAAPEEDPYKVPDGSVQELRDFIEKMNNPPQDLSVLERRAYLSKSRAAVIEAADKILAAKDVEDEVSLGAIQAKVESLDILARMGDKDATERMKAFVDELAKDPRPTIAANGEVLQFQFKLGDALKSEDSRKEKLAEVTKEIMAFLKTKEKKTLPHFGLAYQLASISERVAEPADVAKLYGDVVAMFEGSDEPQILQYVEKMRGSARRFNAVGNPLELAGKTLDGHDLDWASYRGKVVLVDFWATWCGPCIAELPNVVANYEKYHDKGFEVLGISLDEDRDAVIEFVKEKKLPWTTLFSDEPNATGWEHPMANYLGVNAIPLAILVDKDGNVITLNARGEALGEELAKLLGPAEKTLETEEPETEDGT